MSKGFYKNRRLKSLIFFAVCSLVTITPHIVDIKKFSYFVLFLSVVISFYGLIISKGVLIRIFSTKKLVMKSCLY